MAVNNMNRMEFLTGGIDARHCGQCRATLAMKWSALVLLWLGGCASAADLFPPTPLTLPSPSIAPRDTSAYNQKIIDVFNQSQCREIQPLVSPQMRPQMSALGLAVAAYCDSDHAESESLFQTAEAADPSNDNIALLHARFRSSYNPASAEQLWERVLELSRSNNISRVAKAFLQGRGDPAAPIRLEQSWQYYANLQIGPSYETNPLLLAPELQGPASPALNSTISLGAQKALSLGYIAANYQLTYNAYSADGNMNLSEQDLELPLSLRAGPHQDLRIRPFGTFMTLGDTNYYLMGGISVLGVWYRGIYRQTVQGAVFSDHFFSPLLEPQQGWHFRFDYTWEFYPQPWYGRLAFYIEHEEARQFVDPVAQATIRYSHNDIAGEGYIERNFKWVIAGLDVKLLVREDDNDSRWYIGPTLVVRRRQDLLFATQPQLIFPLTARSQVMAFLRWNQRLSNFGPDDYADENYADLVTGVAFRYFWGNF